MVIHILLAMLSTLGAIAALWCARYCHGLMQLLWESESRVKREAAKLNSLSGRLIATEEACDVLGNALRKLTGKFYAERRHEAVAKPDTPPVAVCPNWAQARVDGPGSTASNCTCDYCELQRAERAALRAAVRAAKLGGR
jgi:hypothetical protein